MMASAVIQSRQAKATLEPRLLLAFAAIYFLWGGTFLAIRIAVLQIPPLFAAGLRFFVAGVALHAFMRLRGEPNPTRREWRNLALTSACMFVATYGPLFWAEQYVTSSIASVIEATLPMITITLEVFVFRTQRPEWRQMAGVVAGFSGVALLLFKNESQHLPLIPCLLILAAGIAWSLGAVLSKQLALPASRPLSAGSQMMLGGAALLALSAGRGELSSAPHFTAQAALAMGYLIIFGSLVAYTAYVWLLGQVSATRVASHAYVNPLVAVALGYFLANENITLRTLGASVLIICSVLLILGKQPPEQRPGQSRQQKHPVRSRAPNIQECLPGGTRDPSARSRSL